MNTNEFLVVYASGKRTTFNSTCKDVEDFVNQHFGRGVDPAEHGASVSMTMDDGAAAAPQADAELDTNSPMDDGAAAAQQE